MPRIADLAAIGPHTSVEPSPFMQSGVSMLPVHEPTDEPGLTIQTRLDSAGLDRPMERGSAEILMDSPVAMITICPLEQDEHRHIWRTISVILHRIMAPLTCLHHPKALQVILIPLSITSHAIISQLAIELFLPPLQKLFSPGTITRL